MAINHRAELAQFEMAVALYDAGAHARAAQILLDLLAVNPTAWEAQSVLALCLVSQQRASEAVTHATSAVAAAPDQALPHLALSRARLEGDEVSLAAESCEQALAIDPQNAWGWGLKAKILYQEERYAEAVQAAETGLSFKPTDADCLAEKVLAESMLGIPATAESTRAELLVEEPDAPRAHLVATIQSLLAGDVRNAAVHSEEVSRLWPGPETATLERIVQCARIWMIGQIIACIPNMRGRRVTVLMFGTVVGMCVAPWFLGVAILSLPTIYLSAPLVPAIYAVAFLWLRLQEPAQTLVQILHPARTVLPHSFRLTFLGTLWRLPWWVAAAVAWAFSGAEYPWLATLSTGLVVLPMSSLTRLPTRGIRWFVGALDASVAAHGMILLLCLYVGQAGPLRFMEAAYTANAILVQAFALGCHLIYGLDVFVDAQTILEGGEGTSSTDQDVLNADDVLDAD